MLVIGGPAHLQQVPRGLTVLVSPAGGRMFEYERMTVAFAGATWSVWMPRDYPQRSEALNYMAGVMALVDVMCRVGVC